MPSRGVSQLVIVIVAVALCMAGVYTSLYNVRREMSALKVRGTHRVVEDDTMPS